MLVFLTIVKHDHLHMTKASTIASSFLGGGRFPRSLAKDYDFLFLGGGQQFVMFTCRMGLQGVPSLEQVAAIIHNYS